MTETFDQGMQVRREVLGDAHVDRAEAGKTEFDLPFQSLITESAWGTVWASERITRRERSMLTLALLAATGNFEEIPMHIRATANTGASKADVAEALQHQTEVIPDRWVAALQSYCPAQLALRRLRVTLGIATHAQ